MSTNNFPLVWNKEADDGMLGSLFGGNTSNINSISQFPISTSYNSPFLEKNKPSDGSLLKLNAPISIFGGGGYSYTYDIRICDSGTQVLELYNKTNPQDNQMIMICEETNANKSNLFGTFLLVKFGKDYREMLYKLKNKEKISLISTKANSTGIRINSFDDEITDNLNILKKLFNSDVDFDKVKFAIESELNITSSNGMLLKTIFGGLEGLIEYVTETLNEQFEKIKFTEHDYIPQKAEATSNIVELIEYLNDVQEKGLKTIIDFVLPADIQQMVSQTFDSTLNSIASYAKKELPSGVTKLLEKAYKTIQEGLQFFKEFSEKIANFVGEVALHFKALLMGFVNGLLSTVQMLIQIIGWLIKQMTKLDEKLTGESYRNKQDTFEFIEDLIDLISEQSGAFFAGVASLLADFSFEKMKELFTAFSGSTSKLTSYHYAYYAGSFIFEVVLAVVLAFFTGGASAIAQAASASEKAMATIRLVAREAFSVATMGAIDILKLVRILIAKFAQACKNGWTGFTNFLKKLMSNKTDEIVREEGKLLDELPETKYGKIFRIQGGEFPNSSKYRFFINDNKVAIEGKDMVHITFDDEYRIARFWTKRGNKAEVFTADIDTKFIEKIRKEAVPEIRRKEFPDRPQIDDPTKTKNSFGIPNNYFDELLQSIKNPKIIKY